MKFNLRYRRGFYTTMSGITKQEFNIMDQVGASLLASALKEEAELDAKLAQMDNVDEDTFEALRQKRKLQLQKQMRKEADLKQLGHGTYSEISDTKEFFNAAKKSQKMVVHFYRSVTARCQIVDAHFEKLAQQHIECRFMKIDAEKNPYLVEKLGIVLMPTMVLIKDGKTDHAIHGFDEFGGHDNFTTSDCAYVLAGHGMLNPEKIEDRSEEIAARQENTGFNSIRVSIAAREQPMDDEEDDFENFDDI